MSQERVFAGPGPVWQNVINLTRGWWNELCAQHLVKVVNIDLRLASIRATCLPLPDIVAKLVSRSVLLDT